MKTNFRPDDCTFPGDAWESAHSRDHPGLILQGFFNRKGWTYSDAEEELGVCGYLLKSVCEGMTDVDGLLARDLERAKIKTAKYWNAMQERYNKSVGKL